MSSTTLFFEETSIHGFKYVNSEKRWIFKCTWIVLISLAFSFATMMISDGFANWDNNPTITTIKTTNFPSNRVPLPTISVCYQSKTKENLVAIYFEKMLLRVVESKETFEVFKHLWRQSLFPKLYQHLDKLIKHHRRIGKSLKFMKRQANFQIHEEDANFITKKFNNSQRSEILSMILEKKMMGGSWAVYSYLSNLNSDDLYQEGNKNMTEELVEENDLVLTSLFLDMARKGTVAKILLSLPTMVDALKADEKIQSLFLPIEAQQYNLTLKKVVNNLMPGIKRNSNWRNFAKKELEAMMFLGRMVQPDYEPNEMGLIFTKHVEDILNSSGVSFQSYKHLPELFRLNSHPIFDDSFAHGTRKKYFRNGLIPIFTNIGMCYASDSKLPNEYYKESSYMNAFSKMYFIPPEYRSEEMMEHSKTEIRFLQLNHYSNFKIRIGLSSLGSPFLMSQNDFMVSQGRMTVLKITPIITETTQEFKKLDISQRKCKFPYENDSLKLVHNYTQNGCLFECLLQSSFKECGCYPWNFPQVNQGVDVDSICDAKGTDCFNRHMNHLTSFYYNYNCDCIDSCEEITYTFSVSQKNYSQVVTEMDYYNYEVANIFEVVKSKTLIILKFASPKVIVLSRDVRVSFSDKFAFFGECIMKIYLINNYLSNPSF